MSFHHTYLIIIALKQITTHTIIVLIFDITHIYALAEAAYRSMKDYGENQCVIIRFVVYLID